MADDLSSPGPSGRPVNAPWPEGSARGSDGPSRTETILAYAGAALATLVWVGCVIPGAVLADPHASDEDATPLSRDALLLLPALFLYVTGSVGTTLAAGPTALRAALAAGDGFVTLYVAGALTSRVGDPGLVAIVGLLLVVGYLSLREAVRVLTDGTDPADADVPPAERPGRRWSDVRLALALLVVVMPASLLFKADSERASLVAPFVYVALSAAGARRSRTARGLRLTAAILMALLAAHLVVAIRFVLESGEPRAVAINAAGWATIALAGVVFLLTAARIWLLVRRREVLA